MGSPRKREERVVSRSSTEANHVATASFLEDEDEKLLYTLVHWRLLTKNVNNLSALVAQRGYPRPDLYRRTYDLGDRVVSALGPPDPQTGLCGTYQVEHLARELLSDVNALIEFEMKHGQIPTIIRLQAEHIAELQDIRALLSAELRLLLQAEVRAVIREELPALLRGLPLAALQVSTDTAREEPSASGLLTNIAPGAESMIDGLFNS
jgi:hypothetical protein